MMVQEARQNRKSNPSQSSGQGTGPHEKQAEGPGVKL